MQHYHTIIIWAGQAWLACAYYLQQAGKNFCILEKYNRIGTSRRQRYDSLHLFSPRCCNHLPGYKLPWDFRAFPSKDELADYLETYAHHFNFPIHFKTTVTNITKQQNLFTITTWWKTYTIDNLILATWWFTTPSIPPISNDIDSNIMQLHSTQYLNPQQLNTSWAVVVVGNGNSWIQIADDIKEITDTYLVYLRKRKRIPKIRRGRRLLKVTNVFGIKKNSRLGKFRRKKTEPIIGFNRKHFFKHPHTHDAGSISSVEGTTLICKHMTIENVSSIIRCTWFSEQRPLLDIPETKDATGKLLHDQGVVTSCPWLYTIGIARMRNKGSAMLCKLGSDARYITQQLLKR